MAGSERAASSAPVLLHGTAPPPSALRPIGAPGSRQRHASPQGSANPRRPAAALAPPRPIGSDTNSWGPARFRRPPNRRAHKQGALPSLRGTGPRSGAGGRGQPLPSPAPPANRAAPHRPEATPPKASEPIGGDVNRRRGRALGGVARSRRGTRCSPWSRRHRALRGLRGPRPRPRPGRERSGTGGGRRATLASALELEGTVLREGRLTQFVANNLERRIRLSGAPRGEQPAPGPAPGAGPGAGAGAAAGASSIPAIDPGALQDVVALAGQVAAQVDELLRGVHCGLQALTALSVGCIQTYRDGVESLGEAADLSIRAMYALVARCEELDRAMQPVPALAKRIRDMKGTLERLEGLCK
uniref:BLOC-1 related complex subunit 6 n=1 Tax=Anas zonorhyncha TaxID=75864 RepID=A0A8B9U6D9_9AVES